MASENKKRKARNTYLSNGADKKDGKLKGEMYFTKRQRNKKGQEGGRNKRRKKEGSRRDQVLISSNS